MWSVGRGEGVWSVSRGGVCGMWVEERCVECG